ncbi:MAG: GmrSD restriction endonuclease domain-containing protein [Candidatus Limimorpha sp.]
MSAQHNESIGNKSFVDVKRPTYTQLRQQREIQDMTKADKTWDKEKILKRKEKIIKFIMENF